MAVVYLAFGTSLDAVSEKIPPEKLLKGAGWAGSEVD